MTERKKTSIKKQSYKFRNSTAKPKGTSSYKKAEKNISKRYPNGRTLKTQDRYLPTDKKGVSESPKSQRRVVIIDSNSFDELAVVKLTTQNQPNTTELPTYKNGNGKKSYFKHFVEITDNDGNPIKVDGVKFIENPWAYDLTANQIKLIQNIVYHKVKQAQNNDKKILLLKDRGKKNRKKNPRHS